MNSIYQNIHSEILGTWVEMFEISKSHGTRGSSARTNTERDSKKVLWGLPLAVSMAVFLIPGALVYAACTGSGSAHTGIRVENVFSISSLNNKTCYGLHPNFRLREGF